MPVLPSASSSQETDNSPSSQESSNKSHQESQKATAMDYISKGPQIPDNMPPKASREEIEARMKELNQK